MGPSFKKGARPRRGQSLGVAVHSSNTTDGKRPPRFSEGEMGSDVTGLLSKRPKPSSLSKLCHVLCLLPGTGKDFHSNMKSAQCKDQGAECKNQDGSEVLCAKKTASKRAKCNRMTQHA